MILEVFPNLNDSLISSQLQTLMAAWLLPAKEALSFQWTRVGLRHMDGHWGSLRGQLVGGGHSERARASFCRALGILSCPMY